MKGLWLCGLISMGFGNDLQGRLSHDALISRQDAEIRLLENMKRCISLRIKCDREYAIALLSVCIQAQKSDPVDELQDSRIAKAWNVVIEETEAVSRIIRQNADHLALTTLDSLNNLISEKRALRKMYLDEHSRIHMELTRLQDALYKTKAEYEKCMDLYRVAKAKYEDQYVRGKVNKKLDEAKERYLKLARRLHILHNEYVLLVCEAADYEQHLRTAILPALLDYQQVVLEEAVDSWKNILTDFIKHTDLSGERFQVAHNGLKEMLNAVRGKDEYVTFSQHYRSAVAPQEFQFDESIHDDYVGKLKPRQLAVDDFTYDLLRARHDELQERFASCQVKLKEKQHALRITENEINAMCQKTDTLCIRNVKKRATDILKREVLELECNLKTTKKLLDLIDRAMLGVDTAELPPGLALDENPTSTAAKEDGTLLASAAGKSAAKSIVNKLKNPFQKRQANNDPKSPSLPKRDMPLPSISTPVEEYRYHLGPESLTTSDGYTLMTLNPHRNLQDEDWFHGVLPREEVVRLLANEGDYLVRETIRNEERQLVLSVCWQGHKHFIVQTTADGKYRFEGPSFSTVQELILYQHQSGLPVTSKSGAIMRNPILRERWELNNDDVELVEKIGRGNFGDVYKAKLLPSGIEIAVKTCRMNLPDEQRKKFLQEGRILKQYDHPNIVKFIGICVQKQPIMIVMELVPGGSLLTMLRTQGANLTLYDLLKMCIDTASGMEYLESKNCIHRDLAARNCLVGRNNIVKISDFGMSREAEEEYIVSDGMKQIPIKWTAPEALNFGKYTSLCDVWSYGILMWEVFSLGSTPYCGLSNARTRELIDSGYRLQAPDNTPKEVYEIMLRCWEYEPDRRPHFTEIRAALENVMAGTVDGVAAISSD